MTGHRSGPPRVLRIVTRLNIGGPARQALLLTKSLAGYENVLAAGTPPAHEGEMTDPEIEVSRISLVRPLSPRHDFQAFKSLRQMMVELRPAIVHTHMAKAGAVGRFAAASTRPRPKIVHTYHGHVLDSYFGSLAEKMFLQTERVLAKKTDVLIAISPQVRESLVELGVGREEQYRTIPLGFDLSSHLAVNRPLGLLRSKLGLEAETPLIGSIGRLTPIKDLATLLQAMVQVPHAHLAVLGDGESRHDLQKMTWSLDLGERVHFVGWCRDIPAAMSDMDLVVLSSLNEGTPVSLIEAAASAKAVVATDVGGVRYVVDHEETGLLCRPREPEALAAHIRTLLGDPDLRLRMGGSGRQKVRRLFHKDRLVNEISQLYSELLA